MQLQNHTQMTGAGSAQNTRFDIVLGRLERHDLRNIFTSEAGMFTPWLAQEENIAFLGDTLGLSLEVEAQEKAVGPFRADILCRDTDSDHWVLIENQLERTDHVHLGQLLTYASGLEAVTIIWIAARFTEEHRATLDWLNRITDERFRFFGLEVELWRIGASPAALKFNIVCKPNDWSQTVTQAANAIESTTLSETKLMQRDYWAALNAVLDEVGGPVSGHKKPRRRAAMRFPIGRRRFHLRAVMLRNAGKIRTELYISGAEAKGFFEQLQEQREAVEREIGYPLTWEKLPEGQDSRISCSLGEVDPNNRNDWPRQHRWLAERLNHLHRAFASRVRALDAADETFDVATD